MIDKPSQVRSGEELDRLVLSRYLTSAIDGFGNIVSIQQFPSGYSNLTYAINTESNEYILRRPPIGANIKSAHDISREYQVLGALRQSGYNKAPEPIHLCKEESIIGAQFYLMKRVNGIILRNRLPKELSFSTEDFRQLSKNAIDQLVALHRIDIQNTELQKFGKPEGYIKRQVEGWVGRYEHSKTDDILSMNEVGKWLLANMPSTEKICFLHNDFKYDNLVLDPSQPTRVIAVLDWEMATVGNPLMDLGTTLAYWAQASDSDFLKPFNLTWMAGNMNRAEVVEYYQSKTGVSINNPVFYYAFGAFKVAVICQQIYYRYKNGITNDPRFAVLIDVIKACGTNAVNAIDRNMI